MGLATGGWACLGWVALLVLAIAVPLARLDRRLRLRTRERETVAMDQAATALHRWRQGSAPPTSNPAP